MTRQRSGISRVRSTLLAMALASPLALAGNGNGNACAGLPDHATLSAALSAAVSA